MGEGLNVVFVRFVFWSFGLPLQPLKKWYPTKKRQTLDQVTRSISLDAGDALLFPAKRTGEIMLKVRCLGTMGHEPRLSPENRFVLEDVVVRLFGSCKHGERRVVRPTGRLFLPFAGFQHHARLMHRVSKVKPWPWQVGLKTATATIVAVLAIPGLAGGLIIYRGNPSVSPKRTSMTATVGLFKHVGCPLFGDGLESETQQPPLRVLLFLKTVPPCMT